MLNSIIHIPSHPHFRNENLKVDFANMQKRFFTSLIKVRKEIKYKEDLCIGYHLKCRSLGM